MAKGTTIDIHGIDASVVGDSEGIELDRATLVEPTRLLAWMMDGMDTDDIKRAVAALEKELSNRETTAGEPARSNA